MKKLILILLMVIPLMVFSQKGYVDTTIICIPYKVAKQMALDLNRLDSLTAVNKLTVIELLETQKKVDVQQDIIVTMEQKEKNYELRIEKEKEKFAIVEEQNKTLSKEVKTLISNAALINLE